MQRDGSVFGVVGAVLVLALFVAFLSVTSVAPGHRGVVVTFGSVSNDVRPEGLAWKAPWSRIWSVSVQQSTVVETTGCYSSDQQQLTVSYTVLYRIPEANVVSIFREYPGDPFQNLIRPRVEEALKQVVSTMRAEDSIKERGRVKADTLRRIGDALGGLLTINDLMITNIDLSDELERAIERKQVAEQQALAMEYELKRAQKAAEIQIVNAEAEAKAIAVKGESLVKSPAVIFLDAIAKWDGKAPSTLVVGSGAGVSLIPSPPAP